MASYGPTWVRSPGTRRRCLTWNGIWFRPNASQALEGEIDSADAPILHAAIDAKGEIGDWIATCGQCFSVSARIWR
jgi:hypothetical protein